jgi:hypothetical protein
MTTIRLACAAFLLIGLLASTVDAADRIIVLGLDPTRGGFLPLRVVFWYEIPTVADRLPCPGCASAYGEASADELTKIQSGELIEESFTIEVPDGSTGAFVQTTLANFWTSRKAFLDSKPARGAFYGRTMNDAGVWRPEH